MKQGKRFRFFKNAVLRDVRRQKASQEKDDVDPRLYRAFMGLSPCTRAKYKGALRRLDKWLDGQPLVDRLLGDFLTKEFQRGLSPSTISLAVHAAKFRARALGQPSPAGAQVEQVLQVRPSPGGSGRGRGHARGLTLEQVEHLISHAAEDGTLWALRDSAAISVAFYCGLRRSEVAALRVSDVSFSEDGTAGLLRIRRSKTDQFGQGVMLFLPSAAAAQVGDWLKASELEDGTLFCGLAHGAFGKAKLAPARRFGAWATGEMMRKRAEAAELKGVTSHSFRRSFAQHLMREGCSVAEIALAGRWSSPNMVLRYCKNQMAQRSAVARVFEAKKPLRVVERAV